MRLKSQLLSPSIIYLRVWCGGLLSHQNVASNFYDSGLSSQEVWGPIIFVPASPGLFLLLLMFRNCESSPRVPACCCHPGRWGAATAIRERDSGSAPRWLECDSILSQHNIGFFLSWVLADQRGKFAIFYTQSTFNRQVKAFLIW